MGKGARRERTRAIGGGKERERTDGGSGAGGDFAAAATREKKPSSAISEDGKLVPFPLALLRASRC